jgi:hypothetical protein
MRAAIFIDGKKICILSRPVIVRNQGNAKFCYSHCIFLVAIISLILLLEIELILYNESVISNLSKFKI